MAKKKQCRFETLDGAGRFLRCPECGELLMPQDIEGWSVCPYCNARIESNPDIEDFVLDPLVKQWVNHL